MIGENYFLFLQYGCSSYVNTKGLISIDTKWRNGIACMTAVILCDIIDNNKTDEILSMMKKPKKIKNAKWFGLEDLGSLERSGAFSHIDMEYAQKSAKGISIFHLLALLNTVESVAIPSQILFNSLQMHQAKYFVQNEEETTPDNKQETKYLF